jgi:hypothetical protein
MMSADPGYGSDQRHGLPAAVPIPVVRMPLYSPNNCYRLVLSDDRFGSAQTMEFDAPSAEAMLHKVQRDCFGREVELFEDGRRLGRVKYAENRGYWLLSEMPRDRVRAR